MNLGDLRDGDASLNPVLGLVLLVALAAVLTTVISTAVLGLDDQVSQSPPQANFEFRYDDAAAGPDSFGTTGGGYDGRLVVTHGGGSAVDAARLSVTGASSTSGASSWGPDTASAPQYDDASTISSGDKLTVWVDADDTVRVTWQTEPGAEAVTLNTWPGAGS